MRYGALLLLLPRLVFAEPSADGIKYRDQARQSALGFAVYYIISAVATAQSKVIHTNREKCSKDAQYATKEEIGVKNVMGLLGNASHDEEVAQQLLNLLGLQFPQEWQQVHYCQLLSGGDVMLRQLQRTSAKQIREECESYYQEVKYVYHINDIVLRRYCHTEQQITGKRAALATALQQHQRCE